MNFLLQRLDHQLRAAGTQASAIVIMLLAAAILCTPFVLALVLAWLACAWTQGAFGVRALGWIVGIGVFVGLVRYVWSTGLRGAVRRAAKALMDAA